MIIWRPYSSLTNVDDNYDYVIADVANTFAAEGDKQKSLYYLEQMNERFWRVQGYIPVVTKLIH